MLRSIILTVLLISTPTFGLLQTLFQAHERCYSGCHTNYATVTSNTDACKNGCDYKLYNQNCVEQCRLLSTEDQVRASCLVGCSLMSDIQPDEIENPVVNERPKSIILIRLRQRPTLQLPSFNDVFNKRPADMLNDIIKQWKAETQNLSPTNDLGKSPEWKTVVHLIKAIPLIQSANNVRLDSSSESSEENSKIFKNAFLHGEHHENSLKGRLHQWLHGVRQEWRNLVNKQPTIPIWILLAFFLCLSAFFWYMIVSLCSHAPSHRTLSLQAQEILLENTDEKEKPPAYQSQEIYPTTMKLTNI